MLPALVAGVPSPAKNFGRRSSNRARKKILTTYPLKPCFGSIHKLEMIVDWKAFALTKANQPNQYSKSSLRDQFKNKLISSYRLNVERCVENHLIPSWVESFARSTWCLFTFMSRGKVAVAMAHTLVSPFETLNADTSCVCLFVSSVMWVSKSLKGVNSIGCEIDFGCWL